MAFVTQRNRYPGVIPDHSFGETFELFLRTHRKWLFVIFAVLVLALLGYVFFGWTTIIDTIPLSELPGAAERGAK
jgi:hypothetical protein